MTRRRADGAEPRVRIGRPVDPNAKLPAGLEAASERASVRIGALKHSAADRPGVLAVAHQERLDEIKARAKIRYRSKRPIWVTRELMAVLVTIERLESEPDTVDLKALEGRIDQMTKTFGRHPSELNFLLGVAEAHVIHQRDLRVRAAQES